MEIPHDFVQPRPLLPGEPLDDAVYCAECEILSQNIIGSQQGDCMGIPIPDVNTPMRCPFFKKDVKIVSVFVFLKSGISVYHKAIVKDLAKQIEPSLLTSFLQAISIFGEELVSEQISSISFQKMNIVLSSSKFSNGAMIIKGEIDDNAKNCFSDFLSTLEKSFPEYYDGTLEGRCLPETEVDQVATEHMKEYIRQKFYSIDPSIVQHGCGLKCGASSK